jgi:hypothetical protein
MTEWRLRATHFNLGARWTWVNSLIFRLFTLENRVFPCPHTVAEWVPDPVWTRFQSEKSLSSYRIENQSLDVWSRHYTDRAIPWNVDNSDGNMPTANRFSYLLQTVRPVLVCFFHHEQTKKCSDKHTEWLITWRRNKWRATGVLEPLYRRTLRDN